MENEEVDKYRKTVKKWDIKQILTALQLLNCDKPDALAMIEELDERFHIL